MREIRDNETAYVDAITQTIEMLGGKPVKAPKVGFGDVFTNEKAFLKLAQTLEDTGVGAYNGAAPQIGSGQVLAAAGSIVQVEARHAALIRLMRGVTPAPSAFDPSLDQQEGPHRGHAVRHGLTAGCGAAAQPAAACGVEGAPRG